MTPVTDDILDKSPVVYFNISYINKSEREAIERYEKEKFLIEKHYKLPRLISEGYCECVVALDVSLDDILYSLYKKSSNIKQFKQD